MDSDPHPADARGRCDPPSQNELVVIFGYFELGSSSQVR